MSTLFEQASLVMIPSGYKEDVVYSVKPTDGSGDLTFTRASDGTRVNSQGLVERVPWNLFTYSEDATPNNWGVSVNFASVTANSTTAPNGTNTGNLVIENTATGRHWFEQSFSAIIGTPYTISVYFKAKERTQCALYGYADNGVFLSQIVIFDLSSGSIVSQSGTQTNGIENVGNGWYRCSLTLTSGASATGYFAYGLANGGSSSYQGDGTSGLYMWGRQLNTGTLKPYFPTTDRLNVPRLDYSGGCPSLLLEPQRTNLVTYSEQFDNAAWLKEDISVTSNATTSPDGTQNADKVIANTNNTDHTIYQNTTTSANEYFTVYAKAGEYNYVFLGSNNNVATDGVFFNLTNGTISQNTSSLTATITDAGNGWYRCGVYSSSWPFQYRIICLSENGTSLGFVGDNSKGIYLWGAQVEAGSYPTSYIPTTSASVTRVADAAYKTGISSLIGQTEGTVFLDINHRYLASYPNEYLVNLKDGTNQLWLRKESGGNSLTARLIVGGTNIWTISVNAIDGRNKIALVYKSTDSVVYLNGSQVSTSSASYSGLTLADFYFNAVGSANPETKINQAALFKTRLSNTDLASLTTL